MAWKDGEVVLDNTPLEEALWMLEKRYSVKFVIKNEKLKNSSFTGTFTNQRLEKILEYFKVSSKIRWQHINDDKDGSDRKKEIIEMLPSKIFLLSLIKFSSNSSLTKKPVSG